MMKNSEENLAILKDRQGREVALKGVNVRARLHGLMAEVEVEQLYQNPQKTNIEAVYTFPLPLGAVLLASKSRSAARNFPAAFVEKKQAERDYENAVTDGNSAVMLEEAGPGLYHGKPGQPDGRRIGGDPLSLWFAAVVAGSAPALPVADHHRPPLWRCRGRGSAAASGADLLAWMSITRWISAVTVEGELAAAAIASPSHPITR
jgi:Ca-activated chloride channel family protein